MGNIRDKLQFQYAEEWLRSNRKMSLVLAPRMGKVRTSLLIIDFGNYKNILICYPTKDIETGWQQDIKDLGYNFNITYTTFKSFNKVANESFDLIIVDEIHAASQKELENFGKFTYKIDSLGLTGTLTNSKQRSIFSYTGINVLLRLEINQAIELGILADYQINIHAVDLDNTIRYCGAKKKTELEQFNALLYVESQMKSKGQDTFIMELKKQALLKGSKSRLFKTKELLQKYKDERILVFCGTMEASDSLGIPSYHSKNKKKNAEILRQFCNDDGVNQLACVLMMSAGITIKPIDRGLLSFSTGAPMVTTQKICRFLGKEMNKPGKKATIDIIITNTEYERSRLDTALNWFDPTKINFVRENKLN